MEANLVKMRPQCFDSAVMENLKLDYLSRWRRILCIEKKNWAKGGNMDGSLTNIAVRLDEVEHKFKIEYLTKNNYACFHDYKDVDPG